MLSCSDDESKFSKPLPWIGVYMVLGSLLLSLLMGIDAYHGFHRWKRWFPCKYFTLNAVSLTLLSIATKLPVDLNTFMPSHEDQLSKLSSAVLICTVMCNFITSLGAMDNSELISNVIALVILVITVIANIGIQMGTGVIYAFLPEHAIIMLFMLLLLLIKFSTVIAFLNVQSSLSNQCDEVLGRRDFDGSDVTSKLRDDLLQLLVMAYSKDGQYVVWHLATCSTSGALSLLCALILLQASVRSLTLGSSNFCQGESDYKWSIKLVLVSHAIAVVVGTIAPAFRLFYTIIRSFDTRREWRDELQVEKYWVQILLEWKKYELPFHINSRICKRIISVSRTPILNVCITMQRAVVLMCKIVWLGSFLLVKWLRKLSCSCFKRQLPSTSERSMVEPGSQINLDFSGCRLNLEGKEHLIQLIVDDGLKDIGECYDRGRNNPQNNLIKLLQKCTQGFKRVEEINVEQVHRRSNAEMPRTDCWVVPLVTLTTIAIAIAHTSNDKKRIRVLRRAVDEGLKYVRLFEMRHKGSINMTVAETVWLGGIDTYNRWFREDLKKFAREETNADKILESLARMGGQYSLEAQGSDGNYVGVHDQYAECLASSLMTDLCDTILQKGPWEADALFEWLQVTIADIFGACVTEIQQAISTKYFCSEDVNLREEKVREAVYLLGGIEYILVKLEITNTSEGQLQC